LRGPDRRIDQRELNCRARETPGRIPSSRTSHWIGSVRCGANRINITIAVILELTGLPVERESG